MKAMYIAKKQKENQSNKIKKYFCNISCIFNFIWFACNVYNFMKNLGQAVGWGLLSGTDICGYFSTNSNLYTEYDWNI